VQWAGDEGKDPDHTGFMVKILEGDVAEQKRAAQIDLKLAARSKGTMPDDPCLWGISLRQLQHFRALVYAAGGFRNKDGSFRDLNMYDLCTEFVKPYTVGSGVSLAVLYNKHMPRKGRLANVFVSHSWGESFLSFVSYLESGVGGQTPLTLDDVAWICTFSVCQNQTPEQIAAAISSPMDSPFAQVLAKVDEVAVTFNESVSLYSRVWCVYEAFLALEWGKLVRALGLPPRWGDVTAAVRDLPEEEWDRVIHEFCGKYPINVQEAQASLESDRKNIMEELAGEEDQVNERVNCLRMWALTDIVNGQFQEMRTFKV